MSPFSSIVNHAHHGGIDNHSSPVLAHLPAETLQNIEFLSRKSTISKKMPDGVSEDYPDIGINKS